MSKFILGVFTDRTAAESAIDDLDTEGYNPKDMSIVMRDSHEGEAIAKNTGANVAGGAASGAASGAVIGGLAGLLVGAGAIAIPGIGAFLVGGPLAAALGLTGAAATTISGATTGAVAGGVIGALMGLGLSHEEAKAYETQINEGAILLAVPTVTGAETIAEEILSDNGATDIRRVTMPSDKFVDTKTSSDVVDGDYIDIPQTTPQEHFAVGFKGGKRTRRTKHIIED